MNNRILVISDTHIPYHHPDLLPFLKELKKRIKPDRVIHIGDELDKHALSYHDSDPDLPSAGDELRQSIPVVKELEKLFPKMDLVDSNHGSLVYRKALTHGIPKAYLKKYHEYLEVSKGWKWHDDLIVETPSGPVYFCHGKQKNILRLAEMMGMSTVQGHYHEDFNIQFYSNPFRLNFALQVGCLVDKKSLAMRYNKINKKRPIIGCGAIIEGYPKLIPMPLDKHSRWNGKVYE